MDRQQWQTLDTQKVMERARAQKECTTSGNVGGFEVPIGREPLRPAVPVKPKKKQKK